MPSVYGVHDGVHCAVFAWDDFNWALARQLQLQAQLEERAVLSPPLVLIYMGNRYGWHSIPVENDSAIVACVATDVRICTAGPTRGPLLAMPGGPSPGRSIHSGTTLCIVIISDSPYKIYTVASE